MVQTVVDLFGNGKGFTWPEYYRECNQALQQWEDALACSSINEQSCRSAGEFFRLKLAAGGLWAHGTLRFSGTKLSSVT